VVSDRFSLAYNPHLHWGKRQLCWAHLIRDLTAIAERTGASGEIGAGAAKPAAAACLGSGRWKDAGPGESTGRTTQKNWPAAIRQAFEARCAGGGAGNTNAASDAMGPDVRKPASTNCCKSAMPLDFLEHPVGVETHQTTPPKGPNTPVGDSDAKSSHVSSRPAAPSGRSRLLTVTHHSAPAGVMSGSFWKHGLDCHHRGGLTITPAAIPERSAHSLKSPFAQALRDQEIGASAPTLLNRYLKS